MKATLYIEVYRASPAESSVVLISIETLVVLHTLCCLNLQSGISDIDIVFVETKEKKDCDLPIDSSCLTYRSIHKNGSFDDEHKICPLPLCVIVQDGLKTTVTGLSGVLRRILRICAEDHFLLGFRQSCLIACAEVSVWTRFCEVDVINCVKERLQNRERGLYNFPVDVARLEEHLAHAPRIHNVQKHSQNFVKTNGNKDQSLPHTFAEGPYMTLADLMLFPCFNILLYQYSPVILNQSLPLVSSWFARVLASEEVKRGYHLLLMINEQLSKYGSTEGITTPVVPKESLYKSDPSRYKPRSNKMYTQQCDVEVSLDIVSKLKHDVVQDMKPWKCKDPLNWELLPLDIRPEGGHLPPARQQRKSEQLKNMAEAILRIAMPGHIIVDFCSGSGHLGLLLAYLLPACRVLLLENKDKSLQRAALRIRDLNLKNVQLVQGNLDYFQGNFDIGVALHACGVATDLVLQLCEAKRAAFVICPCCYGSIQEGHTVTYPRSKVFADSPLTMKNYLVLGHCADQTHGETGIKTSQGNLCMAAIDTDRLLHAQENGYEVHLSKMFPDTCSPKNNLLVGIPHEYEILSFQNLSISS